MERFLILLFLLVYIDHIYSHDGRGDDVLSYKVIINGGNKQCVDCKRDLGHPCVTECPLSRPKPWRKILTSELVFKEEECELKRRSSNWKCESDFEGCYRDFRLNVTGLKRGFTISMLLNISMLKSKSVQLFSWGSLSLEMVSTEAKAKTVILKNTKWTTDKKMDNTSFHLLILGSVSKEGVLIEELYIDGQQFEKSNIKINDAKGIRFGWVDEGDSRRYGPLSGRIKLCDVFSFKMKQSEIIQEMQFIHNLQQDLLYPECICSDGSRTLGASPDGSRTMGVSLCGDNSSRLTGDGPDETSFFVPVQALKDGILNESLSYGFWQMNSDDLFIQLGERSIITRFEIIMFDQELRVAYSPSQGVESDFVCSSGYCAFDDQENKLVSEGFGGDALRRYTWTWNDTTAPFVAVDLHLIFKPQRHASTENCSFSDPQADRNRVYEIIIHGRPFFWTNVSRNCLCFPGNGKNQCECEQCKCRAGNWTRAGKKCEPYISHLEPSRTYLFGGCTLTIYGGLLKPFLSDGKPEIKIGASRICSPKFFNDTYIECVVDHQSHLQKGLGMSNVTVQIKMRNYLHPARYTLQVNMTANPIITNISTNKAIFGVPFNMAIEGRNFADLEDLNDIKLIINFGTPAIKTCNGICTTKSDDLIMCKGVIKEPGNLGNADGVKADLSFDINGISTYRNLTAVGPHHTPFIVYRRPIISSQKIQSFRKRLIFQGKYLKNCLYHNITFGKQSCQSIHKNDTTISCSFRGSPDWDEVSVKIYSSECGYIFNGKIPPDDSSKTEEHSIKITATCSVLVVIVLTTSATIGCFLFKKKRINRRRSLEEQEDEQNYQRLLETGSSSPDDLLCLLPEGLRRTIRQNLIDESRLQIQAEIGKGNFGKVFCGVLADGGSINVAIKTLRDDEIVGTRDLINFLEEATIMRSFEHPNVLNLLGVAIRDGRVYVVLPLMKNGDLKSYISQGSFSSVDNIKILCDVVSGMSYLAEQKFVHRDLAARNCMVDESDKVLIADFGLTRDTYEKDYYRPENQQQALPIKWMALESLITHTFSSKSDVWSFGILMWEVFSHGAKPYANIKNINMKMYLKQGFRLERPAGCPDNVYQLMKLCWKKEPNERPSFRFLSFELQKMLAKGSLVSSSTSSTSSSTDSTDSPPPAAGESSQSLKTVSTLLSIHQGIPQHLAGDLPLTKRYNEEIRNSSKPNLSSGKLGKDENVKVNEAKCASKEESAIYRDQEQVSSDQTRNQVASLEKILPTEIPSMQLSVPSFRSPVWDPGEGTSGIHTVPMFKKLGGADNSKPVMNNQVKKCMSNSSVREADLQPSTWYGKSACIKQQTSKGKGNDHLKCTKRARTKSNVQLAIVSSDDSLQPTDRVTDDNYSQFTTRIRGTDNLPLTSRIWDDNYQEITKRMIIQSNIKSTSSNENVQPFRTIKDESQHQPIKRAHVDDCLRSIKMIRGGYHHHTASGVSDNDHLEDRKMSSSSIKVTGYQNPSISASGRISGDDYLELQLINRDGDYREMRSRVSDDDYLQPRSTECHEVHPKSLGSTQEGDYLKPTRMITDGDYLDPTNSDDYLQPVSTRRDNDSIKPKTSTRDDDYLKPTSRSWDDGYINPTSSVDDGDYLRPTSQVTDGNNRQPVEYLKKTNEAKCEQDEDIIDEYELLECLSYKDENSFDSKTDSSASSEVV